MAEPLFSRRLVKGAPEWCALLSTWLATAIVRLQIPEGLQLTSARIPSVEVEVC